MLANHTGWQKFPLTAVGSTDNPSLTASQETTFSLGQIPQSNGKGLAYYLYGVVLSISGSLTQSGGTGVQLFEDGFLRALISQIDVRSAWHGSTHQSAAWQGIWQYPVQFVFNGYRHLKPAIGLRSDNGTYPFNVRVWIPFHFGCGRKPHHTAQLALLWKDAILGVTPPAASALTAISPGASLTGLDVKATAYCLPEPELRLGAPVELYDYTTVPGASTNYLLTFPDFGLQTSLTGVERGAGILWAMLMNRGWAPDNFLDATNDFTSGTLLRAAVPWRDQRELSDVGSFVDEAVDAMGPSARGHFVRTLDAGGVGQIDWSLYPRTLNTLVSFSGPGSESPFAGGSSPDYNSTTDGMYGLPIVSPGYELELSKVQRVAGNAQLQLTFSSAPAGGGRAHLLTAQVLEWQEAKREAWKELVVQSGLAREVLGDAPQFADYEWEAKLLNKQDGSIVDPKKLRYLPLRLANKSSMRKVRV